MCDFLSCIGTINGDLLFLTDEYTVQDSHDAILDVFGVSDGGDSTRFVRLEMEANGKMHCDGGELPRWAYKYQNKWQDRMRTIYKNRVKSKSEPLMTDTKNLATITKVKPFELGNDINDGRNFWGVCKYCFTVFTRYGGTPHQKCPLCEQPMSDRLRKQFKNLIDKYSKK